MNAPVKEKTMWGYYKKTFLAVQVAAGLLGWMVYQNTRPLLGPTWVFVLSMQTSALLGALWAHRPPGEPPLRMPTMLN
jgi:hypothetical protein